jgi:hypothetical protein
MEVRVFDFEYGPIYRLEGEIVKILRRCGKTPPWVRSSGDADAPSG